MVSSVEGMKVLLLDEETTQIVSTVYSQVGALLSDLSPSETSAANHLCDVGRECQPN